MSDMNATDPATLPAVDAELSAELDRLLATSSGQLGLVAEAIQRNIISNRELVDETGIANQGVAANLRATIRTIRTGMPPRAPSVARLTRSAVNSFSKQHREHMSPAARTHVEILQRRIDAVIEDPVANVIEDEDREAKSADLESSLATTGGVYVYSFPQYLKFPTVEGSLRTFLKIGMTTREAADRIGEQLRQTAMPEDPVLLRVYRHDEKTPRELERQFHVLLESAEHARSRSRTGGREWFETSTDFLDAIAEMMGARIVGGTSEPLQ